MQNIYHCIYLEMTQSVFLLCFHLHAFFCCCNRTSQIWFMELCKEMMVKIIIAQIKLWLFVQFGECVCVCAWCVEQWLIYAWLFVHWINLCAHAQLSRWFRHECDKNHLFSLAMLLNGTWISFCFLLIDATFVAGEMRGYIWIDYFL